MEKAGNFTMKNGIFDEKKLEILQWKTEFSMKETKIAYLKKMKISDAGSLLGLTW